MRDSSLTGRVAGPILLGIALLVCSVTVKGFDVAAAGLGREGALLAAYHLARIVLAALIAYAAYACGQVSLRALHGLWPPAAEPGRDELAPKLIMGFAVLSVGMFVLGLCGLYHRLIAIALMAALFVVQPINWKAVFTLGPRTTPMEGREKTRIAVLAVIVLCAAIALLLHRGLFIGETDNDVWEHYLHYYDQVIRRGDVWPNELWVHFYVSKAAGAFFLAALLGDAFSVQLVSLLAVYLMALIGYTFVRSVTDSRMLGLATAALLLAGWNATGGEAGSMLKHHTVVAALVTAVFWCAYEGVFRRTRCEPRIVVAAGLAAGFYLGLHIAVAAGIAGAGLAAMAAVLLVARSSRQRAWIPAALAGAAALGAGITLAINYVWTGLALDAPVGLFWPLANRERFSQIWSPLVVEYWFLGPASVEAGRVTFAGTALLDLSWWARLLRAGFLRPVWLAAAAFALAALAWKVAARKQSVESGDRTAALGSLVSVAAFMGGTLILSQLFRNSESVYRLYAFSLPLVIPALVITWYLAGTVAGAGRREISLWIVILVVAYCTASMLRQVPKERWQAVARHAAGSLSVQDALRQAERSFEGRVTIDMVTEFRQRHPDSRRILFLTYDPAPAYFLPAPAIVSEPSYAFGSRYDQLLFSGDPRRTAQLLKEANIGYVAINLKNRLFLGLPFTELFERRQMQDYFGVAWQRDGIFILGWRTDGTTAALPEELLLAMESKKSGVIPADAEQVWGKEIAAHMRRAAATRDQNSSYLGWLYEEMKSKYRKPAN